MKLSSTQYSIFFELPVSNLEHQRCTETAIWEFFGAGIRNPNTRTAYLYAARSFFDWVRQFGINEPEQVDALLVAKWLDEMLLIHSVPTMKQRLAALKMLFDWLVTKNILKINPVSSVKPPKYTMRVGKTPHLTATEARELLESIDVSCVKGLRDRALIALMTYTFARIGAALKLKNKDLYWQDGRLWVSLIEKGGCRHALPCHHKLEQWIEECRSEGALCASEDCFVFPTIDRKTKQLSKTPLSQSNAYIMVRKRAVEAGIKTEICNHTFRATGITAFLENNGTLERAALIANHASIKTTQLYDRRNEFIFQRDVEKVQI